MSMFNLIFTGQTEVLSQLLGFTNLQKVTKEVYGKAGH